MYPWLEKHWQQLTAIHMSDQLPHALLFESQHGMGVDSFAVDWAQYILCENTDNDQSCQQCVSCHYCQNCNHPDYYEVDLIAAKQSISVIQIRELIDALEKTSQRHSYQVVIIKHADKMTVAAQNALLKTLEEPPGQVHFILLSTKAKSLLATINSRCQIIHFSCDDRRCVSNWFQSQQEVTAIDSSSCDVILNIADWCPLMALEYASLDILAIRDTILKQLIAVMRHQTDPITLSADWQKQSRETYFLLLMTMLRDIMALALGGSSDIINHTDRADVFVKLVKYMNTKDILVFWKTLMSLQRRIQSAAVPNKSLVWDVVLLRWYDLFHIVTKHIAT